jgi:predicted CXXCH cytochrome family protein
MLPRAKIGLILMGLAAGVAGWRAGGGEEPPALRVLFPADRSVVETGQFELIAVQSREAARQGPPPLRVDGVEHPWERYRAPVRVARLKLSPGPHQLRIGDRTLAIFVRGDQAPDPPAGWPVFRQHPPTVPEKAACRSCHPVQKEDAEVALAAPRTPAACDPCHSARQFEASHYHPREPLSSCQRCHALHGSDRRALLKQPVKELCAACHE